MVNLIKLRSEAALTGSQQALVCAIDLTGFTRWVDEEVEAHGADRLEAIADDLSHLLTSAGAILAEEGFLVGSLLGDGLMAVRANSVEDVTAVKERVRAALHRLEPQARIGFGEGVVERRSFAGLPGTSHVIIAGDGISRCYRDLDRAARSAGQRRSPAPVAPSLDRFGTAEIRNMLVGFLAFRAPSFAVLADFVDQKLAIWQARAHASGGSIERLAYDDDALLVRFAWPEAADAVQVGRFLAAQASASNDLQGAWGSATGPVYKARLAGIQSLTGEDLDVAQGPAINHAAKAAKAMLSQVTATADTAPSPLIAAPQPPALLGRATERAWISKRLGAGRRFILISGQPGMGKSSLLKMAAAAVGKGFDRVELAALPDRVLDPLSLWQQFGDGKQDLPVDQRFAQIKQAIVQRAAKRPLMVILDDLQWADAYSRNMLDELVRDVPAITILAAGRPGAETLVNTLEPGDVLYLAGMATGDIEALARSLSTGPTAAIAALAGGNPFLAVQLALSKSSDHDALGSPKDEAAIVDVRLARLAPPALATLRLLAILDRDVNVATLRRVCSEAGIPFDNKALRSLADERFLESSDQADSLRFAHRLIQQRVVEQLPPSAMLRISAVIGRLCRGPFGIGSAPGVIGQHLRNAGQWARAAIADLADAERALALHAHAPAAELFARAEGDLVRVGASADRIALVRAAMGLAKWGTGEVKASIDAAASAAEVLAKAKSWRSMAWVMGAVVTGRRKMIGTRLALALARLAALRSEHGYFTGKLSHIALGGLVAARLGDDRAVARIARTRSMGLFALGLGLVGLKAPARAIFARYQREGGDSLPAAYAFCVEALHHFAQGGWQEGEACLAASEARLGDPPDYHLMGAIMCVRALAQHMQGNFAEASSSFDALLILGRRRENRQFESWALYGSAMPLLATGRIAEAKDRLAQAARLLEGDADPLSGLNYEALEAQLAWLEGRADQAMDHIERSLGVARGIFPANFGSLDGFTLPALVLAEMVSSDDLAPSERGRAAKLLPEAEKMARKFAARCAIGSPRLAAIAAKLAKTPRGRQLGFEHAERASQRLAMPIALLHAAPIALKQEKKYE